MTYKWNDLSKAQQNAARRVRDQLADEGIGVSVSQVAKYFDQAMDFARGQYDRAAFLALTDAVVMAK